MTRRPQSPSARPQALAATLGAFVVLIVGLGLLIILIIGLLSGVAGLGAALLGALCLGVFALALRLFMVARSIRRGPAEAGQRLASRAAGPAPAIRAASTRPPAQQRARTTRPRPRPR